MPKRKKQSEPSEKEMNALIQRRIEARRQAFLMELEQKIKEIEEKHNCKADVVMELHIDGRNVPRIDAIVLPPKQG